MMGRLDMMGEIKRLKAGFQTNIGASKGKRDAIEMKRVFAKPGWMRAPKRTVGQLNLLIQQRAPTTSSCTNYLLTSLSIYTHK